MMNEEMQHRLILLLHAFHGLVDNILCLLLFVITFYCIKNNLKLLKPKAKPIASPPSKEWLWVHKGA